MSQWLLKHELKALFSIKKYQTKERNKEQAANNLIKERIYFVVDSEIKTRTTFIL